MARVYGRVGITGANGGFRSGQVARAVANVEAALAALRDAGTVPPHLLRDGQEIVRGNV